MRASFNNIVLDTQILQQSLDQQSFLLPLGKNMMEKCRQNGLIWSQVVITKVQLKSTNASGNSDFPSSLPASQAYLDRAQQSVAGHVRYPMKRQWVVYKSCEALCPVSSQATEAIFDLKIWSARASASLILCRSRSACLKRIQS